MRRNGFTTIEMIIVVVLIGLIAAIGFPRLRRGLEKQNIRSSKALIATMVATARGTAIQRGCQATLNLSTDSVWVTACGVNPPAPLVTVGTAKKVGSTYNVSLSPSVASIVYDPRGITTAYQASVVRVISTNYRDSVIINEIGKVKRQ
jgi:prepilin-type N-terminal cleavage/methylation domain-containing protein